jgi:hypothetical protein
LKDADSSNLFLLSFQRRLESRDKIKTDYNHWIPACAGMTKLMNVPFFSSLTSSLPDAALYEVWKGDNNRCFKLWLAPSHE